MGTKENIIFLQSKKGVEPITSLTAYDYTSAKILDSAGIDIVLVGDSLGNVMHGNQTTLSVTLDEMIYHGKMVRKGIQRAFLVVDMPFGSYLNVDDGVKNAIRIIKETGADAVKLEGASEVTLHIVRRLLECGVVTMGHVGLQPQMYNVMGGYKIQGRDNYEAVVSDAIALENAGAKLIVLEGLTENCAAEITKKLSIPTIGIGAGIHCDGQILVYHDIFGFFNEFYPKFVKIYANVGDIIKGATEKFIAEVKNKEFPTKEHSYKEKRML